MHDTTLLQLINDDFAPAEKLLALLQDETIALQGRDMLVLEDILARKQSLIILLDQHGRKRSEILSGLGLPANRSGLEQLASHSDLGPQLLAQSEALNQVLADCQAANVINGQAIQTQQLITANQQRILHGGEAHTLYDARGTTALVNKPRAFSQA